MSMKFNTNIEISIEFMRLEHAGNFQRRHLDFFPLVPGFPQGGFRGGGWGWGFTLEGLNFTDFFTDFERKSGCLTDCFAV